jgi:hypothetical protein
MLHSMSRWSDNILKIWDNRDPEHKFKLVCVVHNALDDTWQAKIPDWSRRNAIRLVPISEQYVTCQIHSFPSSKFFSVSESISEACLTKAPAAPIHAFTPLPTNKFSLMLTSPF